MNKNGYIKNITWFIVMSLVILAGIGIANAAVWTDQLDYVPGSTVTISGNNSNDTGYVAEDIVHVDVTGPNGYTSSCSSQVDSSGAWSCQVVLSQDDSAIGDYTYTAVGMNMTEIGTFTDAPISTTLSKPSISATSISLGNSVNIAGTLTVVSGTLSRHTIRLQANINGGGFATTGLTTTTDSLGSYTFSYTPASGGTYVFRTQINPSDVGNPGYAQASSSSSDSLTVVVDSTPPVITPTITGTLGNNGWYISDVTVNWAVYDLESIITSKTGCGQTTITTDTTGVSLTCFATSSGGTSSQSVTIKRDTTSPTVIAIPDRSADHNGWYNKPVAISFSGIDGMSGIESCDPALIHSSDTVGVSVLGNCKDNAGNIGTGSYSLKYDGTAPTITGSKTPSANTNGWNNGDVTVHFVCGDALSGIDSCNSDVVVTTEGSGQSVTGIVTDVAGNIASVKVEDINIDKTVPTISGSPTTSPNGNGWYNSDVTVRFNCEDGLSGIVDSFFDVFVTIEGAGQSVSGTCTDKAGNSIDSTVSGINIDKTSPTITGSRTPSANVYGWNNGDVAVHFDGSDSLSGVDTVTQDTVVSIEGSGQNVEGTVVDKAGNSASVIVGNINIDKTVPTIVPNARLSDDSIYTSGIWTNKDVIVEFSCSDGGGSGVDSCSSPVTKTEEGTGQSVGGTVVDKAGNTASTTFGGINIDKTPPEITGAATTSPNSKGWYSSNVVLHFVSSDALAGIGTSPSDVLLSNDGAGQSASGTATDKAGNSASFTISGINIDKTAPVVTINVPVGGVYILNQNVLADWTVTDAISGIDSATGTVASGSPIDTSTIVSKTFKVTAIDNAGNMAEKTVTYTVQYSQVSGRKILQPLQQVSDPIQLTKAYKLGSTLPVKFQLSDYNGVFVGTAKAIIAVYKTSGIVDLNDPLVVLDSGSSNDNSDIFRYDPVAQQYIYNLNTKNLAVGTFKIVVTLDDGTQILTYFELRK